jgi:polyisoprenoid-binding protein YceI
VIEPDETDPIAYNQQAEPLQGEIHMRRKIITSVLVALLLSACAGTPTTPAPTLSPTLVVTIQPDAAIYTVDTASSTSAYVAGGPFGMQLPGKFNVLGDQILLVPDGSGFRVKMVLSFDVTSATAVDSFMRRQLLASMDSDKFPTGLLTLDSKEIVQSGAASMPITLSGTFDLHGQQRTISFPATLTANDLIIRVTGQLTFKLSDYAITMPIGVSSDEVVFKFDLSAAKVAATPDAAK